MGGMVTRSIEVGSGTCLLGFNGRGYIKSAAFDASTLAPTGGVSEQQLITVTGSPSGGTFTLLYRGQETATIAQGAAASAVQTALRALSTIGSTGVSVAGSSGGPYTVTFAGPLANQDVFTIQLGANSLTGGTSPSVTVAQSVMGVSYDPRYMVGSPDLPGTILAKVVVANAPDKVKEYTAAGGLAEVQSVTITGTPTGGTFTLDYRGDTTGPIAYNALASAVQTALNALATVTADGGVTCSGGQLPGTLVSVTFNDMGARQTMSTTAALTGGSSPAVAVAKTTTGTDPEAIYAVLDGLEEFMGNDVRESRDVAVYMRFCEFDASKIKNYATYKDAFLKWAAQNFCGVQNG